MVGTPEGNTLPDGVMEGPVGASVGAIVSTAVAASDGAGEVVTGAGEMVDGATGPCVAGAIGSADTGENVVCCLSLPPASFDACCPKTTPKSSAATSK